MARSIWTGSITFGLVNVPVKLVTAVRDKTIHFHMLSEDGTCRLRRKLYCPETEEEYDFKKAARGYEIAPEQYVLVNEEEIERARPEAGRAIEIEEFVELSKIDPIYYNRPYYLVPDESGAKAYQLLLEAMEKTQRVAIARFVMRKKQYVAAIRPREDVLVLETMHYADEVASVEDLGGAPKDVDVPKKQMQVAEKLIEELASDEFDPSRYHDEYRERLEELIESKAEGEETISAAAEEEEPPPKAINLMEALEKSLNEAKRSASGGSGSGGGASGKSSSKKASSKKSSSKKKSTSKKKKSA